MAGIGDYIHLYSIDYYYFGTHRGSIRRTITNSSGAVTTTGMQDFSSALKENHESLLSQVRAKTHNVDSKRMSKQLTEIVYKQIDLSSNKLHLSNQYTEAQEKQLSEIIQIMAYSLMLAGGNKDIKYLGPTTLQEVTHEAMASLMKTGKINKSIGETKITAQRLKTIINKLRDTFRKVNELQQSDGVKTARIQKVLDEYDERGKELQRYMADLLASLDESTGRFVEFDTINEKIGKDAKDILAEIFDWFRLFSGQYQFNASGPTFEATLGALNYAKNVTTKKGLEQIGKELDKLVKTGENDVMTARSTSATQVLLSNYATYKDSGYSGMARDEDGNVVQATVDTMGESAITTDLVFYKDRVPSYIAKAMGDIESLNISAKNYTDSSRVHILNDTNLYAILAILNTNFANHYLNLAASNSLESLLSGRAISAEEEIKFAVAIRALTGARSHDLSAGGNSNPTVDCLIINDRSKKEVIVLNIQDLLTKYDKNIDEIIHIRTNGISLSGGNWARSANEIVDPEVKDPVGGYLAARQRITNYINATHKINITATLKTNKVKI